MLLLVYCLFEIIKCSDIYGKVNPSQNINNNNDLYTNNCHLSDQKDKNNESTANIFYRNILQICKPTIDREINNTSQKTTCIIPQKIPITKNETQSNSCLYKIQKYFMMFLFSKKLKERLSSFYELPKALKILSPELIPNKQGLLSRQLLTPKKSLIKTNEVSEKEEENSICTRFIQGKREHFNKTKHFLKEYPTFYAPRYLTEN